MLFKNLSFSFFKMEIFSNYQCLEINQDNSLFIEVCHHLSKSIPYSFHSLSPKSSLEWTSPSTNASGAGWHGGRPPLAKLSKNKFLPETGPCSSWANTFTKFCEQLDLRNILIGLPEGFIHSFQTYKMLPCLTAFLWSGHVVQVTLTLAYSFEWVRNSSCKSSTGRLTISLPKISSFSCKF